jgi:heptosyltransferase-2
MNLNSSHSSEATSPILLVPYMWIGDFVRCHTVVQLLRQRWPQRPIDLLTSQNNAPLLHYMPGVRKGIVCDLPRGRLPLRQYRTLAARLRSEGYGTALVMLRTWKAALALPPDAPQPPVCPEPALVLRHDYIAGWKSGLGLANTAPPVVALAPGAVGPGKRWPTAAFAELARRLTDQGAAIWVVGSPAETPFAKEIAEAAGPRVRDLTGPDLRNAIIALKAAHAAVTNDSGLMHIAAALRTPTVGLFGPTDPRLWGPLNPLAATLEPTRNGSCPRCGKSDCADVRHRRIEDISVDAAFAAARKIINA